jgi:hypothetical protein
MTSPANLELLRAEIGAASKSSKPTGGVRKGSAGGTREDKVREANRELESHVVAPRSISLGAEDSKKRVHYPDTGSSSSSDNSGGGRRNLRSQGKADPTVIVHTDGSTTLAEYFADFDENLRYRRRKKTKSEELVRSGDQVSIISDASDEISDILQILDLDEDHNETFLDAADQLAVGHVAAPASLSPPDSDVEEEDGEGVDADEPFALDLPGPQPPQAPQAQQLAQQPQQGQQAPLIQHAVLVDADGNALEDENGEIQLVSNSKFNSLATRNSTR